MIQIRTVIKPTIATQVNLFISQSKVADSKRSDRGKNMDPEQGVILKIFSHSLNSRFKEALRDTNLSQRFIF